MSEPGTLESFGRVVRTRPRERPMKLVKAIVRPDKADLVRAAVAAVGVHNATITDVRGHGHQKGHTTIYRGQEYEISLLPKLEFEVIAPDSSVAAAVQGIMTVARTGQPGDGRIYVLPVERSYRIRTGEQDPL